MTQEDVVETRMLELEQAFRRRLRADPALRAALPPAVQLVYLAPDDPAYNAEMLARAATLPGGDGAPPLRYVLMSDPPRVSADPPPIAARPAARPPRPAGPSPADWPEVAGIVVAGELRAGRALWRLARGGDRPAALAEFEAAREDELARLRAAGVAAPHALLGAARLGSALALAGLAWGRRRLGRHTPSPDS
ncbi:MAG TPA: hypothetical protein VFW96_13390 [Thermomicrobiales bacterium]|nr:hypothetical protein [Thermomicrobiales bacterium]